MSSEELARERAVFDSGDVDDTESEEDDSDDDDDGQSTLDPPAGGPDASSFGKKQADPNPHPRPVAECSSAAGLSLHNNGISSDLVVSVRHVPVLFDDSRRLFQRLFSDEDEITILRGFLEFVSQRGTTHASYQYDTGPFYDQIKAKLQLDFNKSQLVEKLRRLKKKYRTAAARMSSGKGFAFKSPHDKATFDISRHIWSPTFKRPRDHQPPQRSSNPLDMASQAGIYTNEATPLLESADQKRVIRRRTRESGVGPVDISVEGFASNNVIEETLKSCLSPLFKELLSYAIFGPAMGSNSIHDGPSPAASMGPILLPLLSWLPGDVATPTDDKWRKHQILELEVYAKRMELVKEQIELKLAELKSMES